MRRVGALIFPGFELLDLFGPLEMFGLLKDVTGGAILDHGSAAKVAVRAA